MIALTRHERRLVRSELGLHDATPIRVVPGNGAPKLSGKSYYWTTPSGRTIVHHPNAYGWATRYWPATWLVTVGSEWIARAVRDDHEARMGRAVQPVTRLEAA